LISAVTAFLVALAVVVGTTPVVRRLALNLGAVDKPGGRRVHERVIPRLGGVAIVLAFFVPLLVLFFIETQVARQFFSDPMRIVGLVIGGLMVSGLGVLDDVRGVRALHKLGVQSVAAAVAYACNYRIEGISIPGLGGLELGVLALPMTVLWVVAIINAINLIDGLDGLAGGVAFFACVTNFVVGAINHDALVMLLSASLGGAVLGFLLFNFNPASIFMGDSGSMFLGYVLATTSILGSAIKSSTSVAIMVPLIALGLPIMDTLFAMGRRILERRPIFSPDRGHIHHRLLAMGIDHRRAVLTLYGLSVLFTAGAIMFALGRNWQVGSALILLSAAVIGVVRSMGNFQIALRRWRRRELVRPHVVERLRSAVPGLLTRISEAREVGDIAGLLRELAVAADLSAVELSNSEAAQLAAFVWTAKGSDQATPGREVVTAMYPIKAAGARAQLTFAWMTDEGEVVPESDILLQLVADACDARLARTEVSRIAKAHLRSL